MGIIEAIAGKQIRAAADAAVHVVQVAERHRYDTILGQQVTAMRDKVRLYGERTVASSGMPGSWSNWNRGNGSKWAGGLSTNFPGIQINHWQLRNQARDIYHDSSQARALVDRFADTVVDSGLTLEPEPEYEVLGIDPVAAEEWSRKTKVQFDLWARAKRQHRSQQYNFYQLQHLLGIYQERDNDTFLRFYYSNNTDLLNPLQYELIDPNQIRGDAVTSTTLIGRWPDGITRGPDGSERSYSVWVQDEAAGTFDILEVPRVGEKSKRLMMLHGFVPQYGGQTRGFSGIGFIVQEFENLTDFTSAQIKKAINQSQFVGFVKPSANAPSTAPLDSLANSPVGATNVQVGGPGSPGGMSVSNAVSLGGTSAPHTAIEEVNLTTPGALFLQNLGEGEDITMAQNTAPVVGFKEFTETFVGFLYASRGMPLEVALMHFQNNYSASRACLLLLWRVVCMKREHLSDDFLTPTYEMWLSGEIAAGRISCPGWADPRMKAAWLTCRWNGTPMPNIDPNQTAKADQLLVELGAKTLDDVARETNGSSGKTNRAKLAREFKELNAAGPVPWSMTGLGSPQGPGTANGEPPADSKEPPKKPAPKKGAP